jgi:phosphate starvation-inducible protein PhoH
VASLIFVGAQINQENQVAKATIRQSLNETDMQVFAITMDQSILTKADYKLTKGEALNDYELVFGLGPAGTGKSYLAVAKGIDMLKKGLVEKLILTRYFTRSHPWHSRL